MSSQAKPLSASNFAMQTDFPKSFLQFRHRIKSSLSEVRSVKMRSSVFIQPRPMLSMNKLTKSFHAPQ